MEITGWDTVIFTCQDPRRSLLTVVSILAEKWPNRIIELESPISQEIVPVLSRLKKENGFILVLRDKKMEKFTDENGFASLADGQGPIAFFYRTRGPAIFEIVKMKEVLRETEDLIEPYSAWFSSKAFFEVTVVTPGNPKKDPFSKWACEIVRKTLIGTRTKQK
jgi:hypothetical protein